MEAKLTLFEKNSWKIRTVLSNGEPLFVAVDVCDALELGNTSQAISRLDDDEKGVISNDTLGGVQQFAAVTESGLYSLVLGSRKPEAKTFKRWITHEVLPAIRKHGMYATPDAAEAMLNDPDVMIATLQALKSERAAKVEAQQALAVAAPKAAFYDAVTASDDLMPMDRAAKVLNIKGLGRNNLFCVLRARGILRENNEPYQRYIDKGYFALKETRGWRDANDEYHPTFKTFVTQRGLDFVRRTIQGGEAV